MRNKRLPQCVFIVGLPMAVVAGVLSWYVLAWQQAQRAAYLGCYCQALSFWIDMQQPVPDSIDQFVREYNSHVGTDAFPNTVDFPRPEFRPIREQGEGPFLVLVESAPRRWYQFGRCVIYTDSNYIQREVRCVWASELPKLIGEDDRARIRGRSSFVKPPNAS